MSQPPPDDAEDTERLLLEAAVAEARNGDDAVPHDVMRQRMMEMIAEARRRSAAQAKAGRG
jgi:hypothetical protein